jgi:hypothetical protein
MEQRVVLVGVERRLGRSELANRNAVERPAVSRSNRLQLFRGFRQGDVEDRFACRGAGEQELQRQCGLAGPRNALDQIEPSAHEAATEDVVQTGNAR